MLCRFGPCAEPKFLHNGGGIVPHGTLAQIEPRSDLGDRGGRSPGLQGIEFAFRLGHPWHMSGCESSRLAAG